MTLSYKPIDEADGTAEESLRNPLASTVLQCSVIVFLSVNLGGAFALAPFTLPIEAAANPPGQLDGVLQSSSSIFCLLYCPVSILASIYLAPYAIRLRGPPARRLCHISGLFYVLFGAFAGSAVAKSHALMLRCAIGILSLPLGIFNILVVDHLIAWLPGNTNLAGALASASITAGQFAYPPVFETLTHSMSVVHAIFAAGSIMAAITFVTGMLLTYPPDAFSDLSVGRASDELQVEGGEAKTILPGTERESVLSIRSSHESSHELGSSQHNDPVYPTLKPLELLALPSFWLFSFCAFVCTLCFAIIPYFYTVGQRRFGASDHQVLLWFEIAGFLGIVACFLFPFIASRLQTRVGALSCGNRNVMFAMLLLQAVCMALLRQLSSASGFTLFAVVSAVLRMVKMGDYSISTALVADLFGAQNAGLAFGLGGGAAFGIGEAVGVALMARVDSSYVAIDGMKRYVPWCDQLFVLSIIAMIGALGMRRNYQTV